MKFNEFMLILIAISFHKIVGNFILFLIFFNFKIEKRDEEKSSYEFYFYDENDSSIRQSAEEQNQQIEIIPLESNTNGLF